jgi:hypothetical protein
MDNVVAAQVAIANLNPNGAHGIYVRYCQALVDKALEQQYAQQDSQGCLYSWSTTSRVASSAAAQANQHCCKEY